MVTKSIKKSYVITYLAIKKYYVKTYIPIQATQTANDSDDHPIIHCCVIYIYRFFAKTIVLYTKTIRYTHISITFRGPKLHQQSSYMILNAWYSLALGDRVKLYIYMTMKKTCWLGVTFS